MITIEECIRLNGNYNTEAVLLVESYLKQFGLDTSLEGNDERDVRLLVQGLPSALDYAARGIFGDTNVVSTLNNYASSSGLHFVDSCLDGLLNNGDRKIILRLGEETDRNRVNRPRIFLNLCANVNYRPEVKELPPEIVINPSDSEAYRRAFPAFMQFEIKKN